MDHGLGKNDPFFMLATQDVQTKVNVSVAIGFAVPSPPWLASTTASSPETTSPTLECVEGWV